MILIVVVFDKFPLPFSQLQSDEKWETYSFVSAISSDFWLFSFVCFVKILQDNFLLQGSVMQSTTLKAVVKLVFAKLARIQIILINHVLISVSQNTKQLIINFACL